jgi:4-amino-4-deoxy-L-arabinose transferase-like glycosyltransferase
MDLKTGKVYGLLFVIIVMAVIIRGYFFIGPVGSDDHSYAKLAYSVYEDEFQPKTRHPYAPVFPLRVGLFYPVGLLYKIFGPNLYSTICYPFAISIAGIILAFIAGKIFFGEFAGLFAAAVIALMPLDIHHSTVLLTDLIAAFWASLSIIIIYLGANSILVRKKILMGFLAGFFLLFSWFCKASVVYLAPFLLVYLIIKIRHDRKNLILFLILAAICLSGLLSECFIYYKQTNDWLFRFHEINRNYEVCHNNFFNEGARVGWETGKYFQGLLKRLFWKGPLAFADVSFAYTMVIAFGASIYVLVKRKKQFYFPVFWFCSLGLMFNFMTSSFSTYKPLPLYPTYMHPLILPATLLFSGIFVYIFDKRHAVTGRNIILGLMIAIFFFGIFRDSYKKHIIYKKTDSFREVVKNVSSSDKVYADSKSIRMLHFYKGFPESNNWHDFLEKSAYPTDGSYVLINQIRCSTLKKNGQKIPNYCEHVPGNWKKVYSDSHIGLYYLPENTQQREIKE